MPSSRLPDATHVIRSVETYTGRPERQNYRFPSQPVRDKLDLMMAAGTPY
jgi:hypothetical protein